MSHLIAVMLVVTTLFFEASSKASCPAQPPQPMSGPGGTAYDHDSFTHTEFYYEGGRNKVVHVLIPAAPHPLRAPVFMYLHGYGAQVYDEELYWPFLKHLARRGNIVIYITYGGFTGRANFAANARSGFVTAKAFLDRTSVADWSKFAVGGHSAGAVLATDFANQAARRGYPSPSALVLHEPASLNTPLAGIADLSNLLGVRADAALLIVASRKSITDSEYYFYRTVGPTSRAIWLGLNFLATEKKVALEVRSDDYGCPAVIADHNSILASPGNGYSLDAIDYGAFWRPSAALLDAIFKGTSSDFIFGSAPQVFEMGVWADGMPLKPLQTLVFDP